MEWSDSEAGCIKLLAEMFEKGITEWTIEDGFDAIGLKEQDGSSTLRYLQSQWLIFIPKDVEGYKVTKFSFGGSVIREARYIREHESQSKDIVQHVKTTLNKHPVGGWIILAFAAILFICTFRENLCFPTLQAPKPQRLTW